MISVVVAVAGCTGTPRRTITGTEAIKRLDGYLADAVAAAPAGLLLTRATAEATDTSACTTFLAGSDFTGQVQAEVIFKASDVSADVALQYLNTLEGLWGQKWGNVTRHAYLASVRIDKGKFQLYVHYWSGERASHLLEVGGSSACIWANGTPGPDDDP